MSGSYHGACFCGAVEIEVTGQPNAMGYCHCRSCRWWSGGPVNAFTLWPPEAVKVTKGEQHIGTYHKTEVSHRQFCQLCGGHLMTRHPPLSMIDVFASTIPDLAFAPQLHINYSDRAADTRRLAEGVRRFRRHRLGVAGRHQFVMAATSARP
jgi:hypothetical protein